MSSSSFGEAPLMVCLIFYNLSLLLENFLFLLAIFCFCSRIRCFFSFAAFPKFSLNASSMLWPSLFLRIFSDSFSISFFTCSRISFCSESETKLLTLEEAVALALVFYFVCDLVSDCATAWWSRAIFTTFFLDLNGFLSGVEIGLSLNAFSALFIRLPN